MIAAAGYEVPSQVFDVSFRRPPLNERSAKPLLVGIGDDVAGPLVGLFYDDPSTPEQLAGLPDLAPAHSHPCDNFRVVMKGELWVGQERYHHGEFRLQRSGRPYGRDGDAPHIDGNWRIIMFADRRGHRVRPTNPELRAAYASETAIAQVKAAYGAMLPVVLDDDDDGVDGLVTTIDRTFSKLGHLDSSFLDADSWVPIGDGARICVTLMGHHEVGPVVLVQHTPAHTLATPDCTFSSDVFRCVIAGSHANGEMGDARFQAAGTRWDAVIAGPRGLDEVLIIGDRRGAVASAAGDASQWATTLTDVITKLDASLHAAAANA